MLSMDLQLSGFNRRNISPVDGFPGGTMCKDEHDRAAPDGIATIKISEVRCACADCGAHVVAWQGYKISGWCENCGSYDVRPLPVAPRVLALTGSTLPLAS